MNYTVIQRSGWQGDYWRVSETFQSRADAETHAKKIRTTEARDDGYNVAIRAHKKTLGQLLDIDMNVVFSDGTRAVW